MTEATQAKATKESTAAGFGKLDMSTKEEELTPMGSNPFAAVSLFSSIVGAVTFIPLGGITSVILGYIALSQIKVTGELGRKSALAGIILGWLQVVGHIITIIIVTTAVTNIAPGFTAAVDSFFKTLNGFTNPAGTGSPTFVN